jgi:hypothetical protein
MSALAPIKVAPHLAMVWVIRVLVNMLLVLVVVGFIFNGHFGV